MKLSKKKEQQIYNTVHEEIMQARIKIAPIIKSQPEFDEIDNILSALCYSAPQKAIDIFKTKQL